MSHYSSLSFHQIKSIFPMFTNFLLTVSRQRFLSPSFFFFSPRLLTRWFEVLICDIDYDYWIKPLSVKIWIWVAESNNFTKRHSINLQCHLCELTYTQTKIYILIEDNVIYIYIAISLFLIVMISIAFNVISFMYGFITYQHWN